VRIQLESDLRTLLGARRHAARAALPRLGNAALRPVQPAPDIVSQRLAALHALPTLKRGIVVVPVQTLLQRAGAAAYVVGNTFDVRVGQRSTSTREAPAGIAPATATCRRCSIPATSPCAAACSTCIRWARTSRIASNCSTTRSIRSAPSIRNRSARSTRSTPCNCCPAAKCRSTTAAQARDGGAARRFDIDTRRSALFQDLKAALAPAGIEYYLPLFFDKTATLFDYLGDACCRSSATARSAAPSVLDADRERYEQRRHDIERPLLPPTSCTCRRMRCAKRSTRAARRRRRRRRRQGAAGACLRRATRAGCPGGGERRRARGGAEIIPGVVPGRVLIAADSAGRRECTVRGVAGRGAEPRTLSGWTEFLGDDARLAIAVARSTTASPSTNHRWRSSPNASSFPNAPRNPPPQARRPRTRPDHPRPRELSEGAPMVHEDHGVGRYRGLIKLDAGGMPANSWRSSTPRATACTCRSRSCT
jgi:transcription-repair coupling factor (superfamily II helicase)